MCRCCQNCWEDFYWNCFEERFCYDESIANYNPDEDEAYMASQKNGAIFTTTTTADNNNLTVPQPICAQPVRRGNAAAMLMSNAKIHEEDYRRETQTNVPMLGPEIITVFANSQIFQDHQPTKLNRISTKTHLSLGSPAMKDVEFLTAPAGGGANRVGTDQERLVKRLEENLQNASAAEPISHSPEKRITFTLASDTDSSPEGSLTALPTQQSKFAAIEEEEGVGGDDTATPYLRRRFDNTGSTNTLERASDERDGISDEVILRPRLIDRHPHLMSSHISEFGVSNGNGSGGTKANRTLRSVRSVPHLNRSVTSEIDIFSITGSGGGPISMTPEVPSISYSNLPKHYEDTPTIEKYRVSQSLFSIQVANEARATRYDYSMPRYFRRSAMAQSTEAIPTAVASAAPAASAKGEMQKRVEKSKRLQMMRGNLPPLLIHSVSFRKSRDDKQGE